MTLAPFLVFTPAWGVLVGITELPYTCIGTRVLPRAQGANAPSARRSTMLERRAEPMHGSDPCPVRTGREQEPAALVKPEPPGSPNLVYVQRYLHAH
jgi:hypothetical protein